MFSPVVVGIDPSIKRTAACWFREPAEIEFEIFSTRAHSPRDVHDRFTAYREVGIALCKWIEKVSPSLVVFEGYSFGSNTIGHHNLVTHAGIMRLAVVGSCKRVIEVPPTTLKRFATQKGNATKQQVKERVENEFGIKVAGYDEADSLAAAWLGALIEGMVGPLNDTQEEIAEKYAPWS